MNSRERTRALIAGETADRCGFWLGNPHETSWPGLHRYFGTTSEDALRQKLGDDYYWMPPRTAYKDPAGKPMFDMQRRGISLSAEGAFGDCEDVQEVEDFAWPNPDYLDFSELMQQLQNAGDRYRASGFWCPFFHQVADFFGMENYFVKMYTHPEVVHAVTRHIIDFYLEGNRRLYETAGDLIDGFFLGNDLGSQLDLLVSPKMLDTFVFPYMQELTDQARDHGYQVILHSCGAIFKVIPRFIELGVQGLHPLQAKAVGMAAEKLSQAYKGKITFIGGIDTQDLLINATPEGVKDDVRRVKSLLGPNLVVSPSHEAILPNVPPANIEAMVEATLE